MFGVDPLGQSLIQISNQDGQPKQDILLPICYRNPPWILTLALGVGLGIKRNGNFVQMFSEPDFWEEIGYKTTNNTQLGLGQHVRLKRDVERSATFFANNLTTDESVIWRKFNSMSEQLDWVANDIKNIIATEELDLNDILIVFPDSIAASKIGNNLSVALRNHNLKSHLIGVNASNDVVFIEDSIAMCSIHRAKGNEAPLVYVVGAEFCNIGTDLGKKRNILFTALTRAKAWIRVCGLGVYMDTLIQEFEAIKADNFELDFMYPTEDAIRELRKAYRERTASEKRKVKKEIESAKSLLRRIAEGEVDLGELPPDLAELLRKALK